LQAGEILQMEKLHPEYGISNAKKFLSLLSYCFWIHMLPGKKGT